MPTGVYIRRIRPVAERFWEKVDRNGPIPSERPELGSCWQWLSRINPDGYGHFWLDGSAQQAHVVAYVLTNGPKPPNTDLDHLCRNRSCVNLSHLEAVTHRENVLRGEGLAAQEARQTHCVNGHPFDTVNTSQSGRSRKCRACHAEVSRQYRQRQKEHASDR